MSTPTLSFAQPLTLAALAAALRGQEPQRLPAEAAPAPTAYPPQAAPTDTQSAHWLPAHACGTGPEVPPELVRRLLLLKAHSLSLDASTNPLIIKILLDFYNREVWPVIYEQGAMETPLAHLALPLLGLGEVNYQGYRLAAADVLELFGWAPLAPTMAESQALLRGHEFALAYSTEALERAAGLLRANAAIAALGAASQPPAPGPEALAEAAHAAEAVGNHLATPDTLSLIPNILASVLAAVGQASAGRTGSLLAAPPAADAAATGPLVALPVVAAGLAAASQRLAAGAGPAEVRRLVENTEQLLGLELLAAAQRLDEQRAATNGPLPPAVAAFREVVTFAAPGRLLAPDLHRAARFVREYEWA